MITRSLSTLRLNNGIVVLRCLIIDQADYFVTIFAIVIWSLRVYNQRSSTSYRRN